VAFLRSNKVLAITYEYILSLVDVILLAFQNENHSMVDTSHVGGCAVLESMTCHSEGSCARPEGASTGLNQLREQYRVSLISK
jgi:hypothetical protein